jgi:hypothetical protein
VSCSRFLLVLLLLLGCCGDRPRPFQGAPGATAMRLAQPPAARIAVPPATNAALPEAAARPYAAAVAAALQDEELPAVAETPRAGDWQLSLRADANGGMATPVFTLLDPAGKEQGSEQASPVPVEVWRQARAETLKKAATEIAPKIAKLLARVEAVRRQNDPNSLFNRPARVAITEVTGAPGDGNIALARLMREKLGKYGILVQDSTTGVDFTVWAKVNNQAASPTLRRIEIFWLVYNGRGDEIGKIVQLNEVPNGTLDRYWGDVAVVVTEEASAAVRDVILTQSGRR